MLFYCTLEAGSRTKGKSNNETPESPSELLNWNKKNNPDNLDDIQANTVKPVLSGHSVLSGQLPKSRIESRITYENTTFIRRAPLLSGRADVKT